MTNFHLPGEEGFKDGRGSTMFPELPGQSRDPIYNTTLPTASRDERQPTTTTKGAEK